MKKNDKIDKQARVYAFAEKDRGRSDMKCCAKDFAAGARWMKAEMAVWRAERDSILMCMDSAEILYYLEGCARGSHLRQGCWHDMIHLYPMMSDDMRRFIHTYAKRDIAPIFEQAGDYLGNLGRPDFEQFLACFDPNNRYMVTARHGDEIDAEECYLWHDTYYIDERSYFHKLYIVKVEHIEPKDNG